MQKTSLQTISYVDLVYVLIPVLITLFIFYRWRVRSTTMIYAHIRMFLQLMAIGYCLKYIFNSSQPLIIILILITMIIIAGFISPKPLKKKEPYHYAYSILSIFIAGSLTVFIVTQVVVRPVPWYNPHVLIPLSGMIFSNCMNAISLAAERFESEQSSSFNIRRNIAFHASLIPITNSLVAVGLVSLPGTMTGMILSGISPLIAVKYQMLVMCAIFGSTGISAATYLSLLKLKQAHH